MHPDNTEPLHDIGGVLSGLQYTVYTTHSTYDNELRSLAAQKTLAGLLLLLESNNNSGLGHHNLTSRLCLCGGQQESAFGAKTTGLHVTQRPRSRSRRA